MVEYFLNFVNVANFRQIWSHSARPIVGRIKLFPKLYANELYKKRRNDLLRSSAVFFTALFLFAGGFLLRRQELPNKSSCLNTTGRPLTSSCNSVPQQFSKSIIIIVDALKFEFAVYNASIRPEAAKPFQNRLPVLRPEHGGRLFEFVADPPTTTMQRLKGLTTGERALSLFIAQISKIPQGQWLKHS